MVSQVVTSEFFAPTSVAIIGASEQSGKIGSGIYRSITADFQGPVYCVNPRHHTMWGGPCYHSVEELPEPVSHAIIAVSRDHVLSSLRACLATQIPNIVVVTSGFKEADEAGAALEAEMQALCQPAGARLLGPNTLGFINTAAGFNGTFLPEHYLSGGVSVISQSGGVGMALLAALQDYHCGIGKWVGIGNEAALTACDFLQYFAEDPETRVIAVCFEGLRDTAGFLRLAERINRKKPIVILRDGKGAAGMRAAASHTGTLVQSPQVLSDLIHQLGLLEATSCRQCAVILKALSLARPSSGNRAILLSNTAGPSILAADTLEASGVALPSPSTGLQDTLDQNIGMSLHLNNPADISSNGLSPQNYGIAADTLLSSSEYDILLGFFSLNQHLHTPDSELAHAACHADKPVVACFLSSTEVFRQYDRRIECSGIPCYWDPQDAADALAALVHRGTVLQRGSCVPGSIFTEAQRDAVATILGEFPAGSTLPERDARRLLKAAGISIQVPVLCTDADAAVSAADHCGYPVCLKLHSSRLTHKTDVGGVRLNLNSAGEVRSAFQEMLPALQKLDPDAMLTVQPMAQDGFELIVGATRPASLGPLVMAGMGGVYSELLQDVAFRMAPIDQAEASRQLHSLRCGQVFEGYRGIPLDRSAVVDLICRVGELIAAFPQLQELDLNPCRVYAHGLEVLDARAVLQG